MHEKTEFSVSVIGCGRMGCAIAGGRAPLNRAVAGRRPSTTDSHTVAGEFVRRGCTVFLYDHTEYTRNRAFQTLRASLYDHVC